MENTEEIKEIKDILKENGYYAEDVYQDSTCPNVVYIVEIEGDWRHDHLAAMHFLSEKGWNEIKNVEIGDSMDDWYRSRHYVMKASKEYISALFEMFAA